jgi:8-oxo-dGTP pyrophosphatase MutT (NUDIX family)
LAKSINIQYLLPHTSYMATSPYPSKFIQLSASVLLLRPCQASAGSLSTAKSPSTASKLDYQVLLLKRHSKLSFANYFAFPGGMVEKQDYAHKW